jgi:hypothetical protein
MNTTRGNTEPPQIAIWCFVGATFLFVAPTLFFPDADLWVRIVLFAAGFLAIVGGVIQLGREIRKRRDQRDESSRDENPPQPDS